MSARRMSLRVRARLATEHGADGHCGLGGIAQTSALVYDWLIDVLTGPDRPRS